MKFGLIFPNYGSFCSVSFLKKLASIADGNFQALLTWDHFLYRNDNYTLDAFSLLSNLAAQTQFVKLGTCVTPLVLRGPVITAKLLSSLDMISNGRAILGIGAGWFKSEFDLLGNWKKASERVRATEEAIRSLKGLLRNYEDGKSESPTFPCLQRPHPPIWIGTKRNHMLRIAASIADGWIPTRLPPAEYKGKLEQIKSIRKASEGFTFGCHLSARFAKDDQRSYIESLSDSGCNFVAIYPQGGTEEYVKGAKRFAELIHSFS